IENVGANASLEEQERFATEFIEGHAAVYRALARAVVPNVPGAPDRGLRVIFVRGNHDPQTVNRKLRAYMIEEMIRVGGLDGGEAQRFRERVAFGGDMAVLGKHGE